MKRILISLVAGTLLAACQAVPRYEATSLQLQPQDSQWRTAISTP